MSEIFPLIDTLNPQRISQEILESDEYRNTITNLLHHGKGNQLPRTYGYESSDTPWKLAFHDYLIRTKTVYTLIEDMYFQMQEG
ncbi:MAG: hypothetical protein HQM14_10745 [SAR324 cluster bacterium]|nr:hypothetical protein [SAR324 cluster bacterium]